MQRVINRIVILFFLFFFAFFNKIKEKVTNGISDNSSTSIRVAHRVRLRTLARDISLLTLYMLLCRLGAFRWYPSRKETNRTIITISEGTLLLAIVGHASSWRDILSNSEFEQHR